MSPALLPTILSISIRTVLLVVRLQYTVGAKSNDVTQATFDIPSSVHQLERDGLADALVLLSEKGARS